MTTAIRNVKLTKSRYPIIKSFWTFFRAKSHCPVCHHRIGFIPSIRTTTHHEKLHRVVCRKPEFLEVRRLCFVIGPRAHACVAKNKPSVRPTGWHCSAFLDVYLFVRTLRTVARGKHQHR